MPIRELSTRHITKMQGKELSLKLSSDVADLSEVKIPGMTKDFDKMTIGELTQLRPGSSAEDNYNITAFTDNATISTSSVLEQLGRTKANEAMRSKVLESKINARTGVIR